MLSNLNVMLSSVNQIHLQVQWYPKTDSGMDHNSQDYYSELYLMHKFWKIQEIQAESLG